MPHLLKSYFIIISSTCKTVCISRLLYFNKIIIIVIIIIIIIIYRNNDHEYEE